MGQEGPGARCPVSLATLMRSRLVRNLVPKSKMESDKRCPLFTREHTRGRVHSPPTHIVSVVLSRQLSVTFSKCMVSFLGLCLRWNCSPVACLSNSLLSGAADSSVATTVWIVCYKIVVFFQKFLHSLRKRRDWTHESIHWQILPCWTHHLRMFQITSVFLLERWSAGICSAILTTDCSSN